MKLRILSSVINASVLSVMLLPLSSLALDIKPGKWAFDVTSTMPMSPQPVQQHKEECVKEGLNPAADMQAQMTKMGAQCTVDIKEDTKNSFGATMHCPVPGAGAMDGTISFNVSGDTANGKVDMNMNMNGQTMKIASTTTAKYLGSCD